MSTEVLGSLTFIDNPTAGGIQLVLNSNGVPSLYADVTANRPAAGTTGRLFVDTTSNIIQRDNGASWDTLSNVITYTGTANQIDVAGGVISISSDLILPGTSRVRLPSGTTAQRPASPGAGDMRFNSTLGYAEKYTGSYWGPLGLVLQQVTGTIAASSGTGTIPYDNTTPMSTEGYQIWTQSFTPLSATSRILIQFTITAASSSTASILTCAVFSGSTIISASSNRAAPTAGQPINVSMTALWVPGSTATTTLSARLGPSNGATAYCNQGSGATLGGAYVSSYVITEIE